MQLDDEPPEDPWRFAGIADPDQIDHLDEYDDANEFAIANEFSVGTYLSGYAEPESVSFDDTEHVFKRGRCVRCGVTEKQLVLDKAPWDGPAGECPGEPPP